MNARQVLLLLALGVSSSVIGYSLAFILFSDTLVTAFALGGSGEWERSVIGDIAFQLFCGTPLPLIVGASIGLTPVVISRLFRIDTGVWLPMVPILGFFAGFIGYFPWQLLLLLGAAF